MTKAIIFDLDGTLVDNEALHQQAFRQTLSERGLRFVPEEYARSFGRPGEVFCRHVLGPNATAAQVAVLLNRKTEIYQRSIRNGVRAADGAAEFLKSAGRVFKLAIATSTRRGNLEILMNRFGWWLHFEAIVAAEDTERAKPEPDCLLLAAGRLGVEPTACCVIEDAPYGIEAARRAGMKSVGVTACNLYPRDLSAATMVVEKLSDISLERIRDL